MRPENKSTAGKPTVTEPGMARVRQSPVIQRKPAPPPVYRPAGQKAVAPPPVYRPQLPAVRPIQPIMAPAAAMAIASQAIQMQPCDCGKPGNKHKNTCPRHKANLAKERHNQKVQNTKKNTAKNIATYAPDQADKTDAFIAAGGKVRGHRRGNANSGRQGNTNADVKKLRKFK